MLSMTTLGAGYPHPAVRLTAPAPAVLETTTVLVLPHRKLAVLHRRMVPGQDAHDLPCARGLSPVDILKLRRNEGSD